MKTRSFTLILPSLVLALLLAGCGDPGARAIRSGVKALERGKWPQAVEAFQKALEQRSSPADKAFLYNLLGKAYFHADQLEEAARAFQKSRGYNPDQMEAAYNLGVLHCARGELYAGATLLEEAALIDAVDTRAYEYLAAEYLKAKKVDEALAVLRKAQERQPGSPRVLAAIALAGLEQEGDIFAVTHLNQALKRDAAYAPALFNLGRIHDIRLKDRVGSLKYYNRFLEVSGDENRTKLARDAVIRMGGDAPAVSPAPGMDEPPLATPLPEPAPPAEPRRGDTPMPHTNAQQVTHLLESARNEMRSGSSTGALNLCLQAAAVAERAGDRPLQEKALKTAVSLCPGTAKAHFNLGAFYRDEERYSEAVRAFGSATTLQPDWSAAHMAHAAAAIEAHEYETALEALRQAVKVDPGSADALWALGLFYDSQLKMPDRARDAYGLFIEKFSDDTRVPGAKQRLAKLGGNPETPLTAPRKPPVPEEAGVLRHERISLSPVSELPVPPPPEDADPSPRPTLPPKPPPAAAPPPVESGRNQAVRLFNQGTAFQSRGDFEAAARLYRQSIAADGGYGPPHYNLGIILQKQGDAEAAEKAYTKALEIRPDLALARYNLALIYKGSNRSGEAISALRKVIESNTNYAPAYYELGTLYAEDPQTRYLARNYYSRFLQMAPNDPAAGPVRNWLQRN